MAKVSSTTRTRSTHTVSETINGVDHEFEVQFEPSDYNEISVKVSSNGKRAVVGYISRDDNNDTDPRAEFDQIDHLICFHSNYNLGDKHDYKDSEAFIESLCREAINDDDKFDKMLENLEKRIEKVRGIRNYSDTSYWRDIDSLKSEFYDKILDKNYVMLPVGLYDHSGISMYTGVTRGWDNSNVGYIYMSYQAAWINFGVVPGRKARTKAWQERMVASMKSSVEEYDKYLTGDVWGVCYDTFNNIAEEGDEPEWEEDEQDNCWGFFGDKYAEEDMKSGMKYREELIEKPVPAAEDPNQPNLFQEAA